MRHFLLTDPEGTAGPWFGQQTREEGSANMRTMHLPMGEVAAVTNGILEADPQAEVGAWAGHSSGGLIHEKRHEHLLYMSGQVPVPRALQRWADTLYFVGQYAMASTPAAPLCHTYSSPTVSEYRLTGSPVGEFGCRAALAGTGHPYYLPQQ